jgi:hypothetical protein
MSLEGHLKQQSKDQRLRDYVADLPAHVEFPKISRLNRDIIITEKIDGSNGAICITPDGRVYAQSRKRIVSVETDSFGFAKWVAENAEDLRNVLGPGLHFGEWWGRGIQRGYGTDKRFFSLFNVNRWSNDPSVGALAGIGLQVVPLLYKGPWNAPGSYVYTPDAMLKMLAQRGSWAMPGYKCEPVEKDDTGRKFVERFTGKMFRSETGPEGIVVMHIAGMHLFKATLENDEGHKFQLTDEEVISGIVAPDRVMEALQDDEINRDVE